eukprot:g3125.t1
MSSAGLQEAVDWMDGLEHPDAFVVARGGLIVAEKYWAPTTASSLHDLASGTKSVASLALAHAVHMGHFGPDSNLTDYFPSLRGLSPDADAVPLQLKHLRAMAGGANVSYWQTSPEAGLTQRWTAGLRQGPPGEVASCAAHGVRRRPGSDFLYSFANPALAGGLLREATGLSYAQYLDEHVFRALGISRDEWRWLGDREGNSQPDGGSFHSARSYAKLAYLMLRGGRWEGTQLLSPAWVAGAAAPTPADEGPCPVYSHFFWRKDLNAGTSLSARRVPSDTFYAYGGGGQFAVVVPSLDLVVVSLYGGRAAVFSPPADAAQWGAAPFFPNATDTLIMNDLCCGGFHGWGCWNFSFRSGGIDRAGGHATGPQKIRPGMPSTACSAQDTAPNDLLAGMVQRVVAAVL